jgi:hypothetical protein
MGHNARNIASQQQADIFTRDFQANQRTFLGCECGQSKGKETKRFF